MGSNDEGQAPMSRLLEVAALSFVPMALQAAIQLNVMDILAEHGGFLSPPQIASHFERPLAPTTCLEQASTSLDRILRLLASHGLLASSLLETPHGEPIRAYSLNSISRLLVKNKTQPSFAPFLIFLQHPVFIECLYNLHEAVLDGVSPFSKAHGMPMFSYLQKDAKVSKVFNDAMASLSKLVIPSLLETYKGFEEITSLLDLGGGTGTSLAMITSHHPHIKGINFDRPHVIAAAQEYPGVKHVAGDMFVTIPKADTIFMKGLLVDWSDADCLRILQNCYQALPTKGKIIVVDAILPLSVETGLNARANYFLDLIMFAHTEGGKEITTMELESISKVAGFSELKVACSLSNYSVLEIIKGSTL